MQQQQQVYSAQFKQYRFELDLLRRQNMQLMERLNSLERKVNVLQMSPIEEETHHQRTQCVLFEEEKSNEHMHGSDEHKNETEGIQQLTSQLLLYREKFSSLQQQSRMAAADDVNTPCKNQPATATADGQEQHQQDEQPEDELSEKQRELLQWLEERELDEYFCVFRKHGFDDLASLKFLTMNELNEIGIEKLGHRMKILHSIEKLKSKYLPLYHMGYDSVIEYDSKDLNLAYEKSHEI